jgi:O-antigen/teichoic acid export membrane protein
MNSLKMKTVRGFKWLAFNQFIQRVLRLISTAVLARILAPSEFGLFAMAFIAIDAFSFFKSFGVDAALIQKKEDEDFETAKHTAFWIIQATGLVIFLLFQIAAPFVAAGLRNPDLVVILRVLGAIFIINNFGRISTSLLTKKMRFAMVSVIELISSVANILVSIALAYAWKSVWSLVVAYLVKMVITGVMSVMYEPYRAKFVFDRKLAKEMMHFGKFMVGGTIVAYVTNNLEQIIIARYLGAVLLGYFVLARNITSFTQQQVVAHISRVLFPAFASIQNDPQALKRAYLGTARYISIIAIPFSVGIAAVAEEFTLALYGEKWLEIVPLIQVLALTQIVGPLTAGTGAVYMGSGKTKWTYYLNIARLAVKVPLLYFMGKNYGLMGVAYSGIVTQLLFSPITFHLTRRLIPFSTLDWLKQFIPATVSSAVMLGAIYGVKFLLQAYPGLVFFNFHHLLPLIYCALLGLPAYVISFYFVDRQLMRDVFKMVFRLEKA